MERVQLYIQQLRRKITQTNKNRDLTKKSVHSMDKHEGCTYKRVAEIVKERPVISYIHKHH